MKAADLPKRSAVQKPSHVVTLGPRSFSSRWGGRPTAPLAMGLRIASAEERLQASTEATARTDRTLPELTARLGESRTEDPCWAATFQVSWIHYLLGMVLTSPNDVNAPLWAEQDGSLLLCEVEPHEAGDAALTSTRFTDEAIARLWDEYEALSISQSEVWPEATRDELKKLGTRLADGSFFAGLDDAAKAGDEEAEQVAAQIRRLLAYTIHLRRNGRQTAPRPT